MRWRPNVTTTHHFVLFSGFSLQGRLPRLGHVKDILGIGFKGDNLIDSDGVLKLITRLNYM